MVKELKQLWLLLSIKKVLVPLLIFSFVLIGLSLYWFARQNKKLEKNYAGQFVLANQERHFHELFQHVQLAESNVRGYVASGNKEFVKDFRPDIDSIKANYSYLLAYEKANRISVDPHLYTTFDSLILRKISFTQQVKALYDRGDHNAASELIASKEGMLLSQLIIDVHEAKNKAIRNSLQQTSTVFIKGNNRNNSIAYTIIITAMLLIVVIIYLLVKEISRRKKLSEELKKQKEDFIITLNSLGEAVISTDKAGKIQYMNPVAERLSGWSWRDAEKQPLNKVFNVVNEETGKPIENIVSRILRDGKTIEFENNTILQAKDNRRLIISNNGSPLVDSEGNISGVVLVFDDITDRKRAEKEIKDYKYALDQSSVVDVSDSRGIIEYANENFFRVTGYSKEEIIGQGHRILNSGYHTKAFIKELWDTVTKGKVWRAEVKNKTKKGTHYWVDTTIVPFLDADNKPFQYIAIRTNITERKEAEEKYWSLVEQAADAIMVFDSRGKIITANTSSCLMLGYDNETLLKLNLTDITPDRFKGKLPIDLSELNAKKGVLVEREFKCFNGSCFYAEVSAQLTTDGNIQTFVRDITERKKTEEEQKLFRTLIDNSNDAIEVIDSETGRFLDGNEKAWSSLGYTKEEFLTLSLFDIDPMINPSLFAQAQLELHKSGTLMWEGIHRRKDGSTFPVEVNIRLIRFEKEYLITVARDVTERKKAEQQLRESEAKLREITASLPGVVYQMAVKPDGKILFNFLSDGIKNYLDEKIEDIYKDSSILLSKIYPEDVGRLNAAIALSNKNLTPLTISYRTFIKGRGSIWVRSDSIPVLQKDGTILRNGALTNITETKVAEEKIIEANKQLRLLSEYLQNIREEERTHIAREIHDELGQQLTIMKMDVSWLDEKLGKTNESVGLRTKELKEMLDKTVMTVRKIASDLRPSLLDDMGLGAAIEWQLAEFEKRSGVKTKFVNMETEMVLSDNVKTGLFRIVQESLTNVSRYANAKKTTISLQQKEGNIVLVIKDNGAGFDKEKIASKKTFGILGMKERSEMLGGVYEINSIPGKGTTITVTVPYPVKSKA